MPEKADGLIKKMKLGGFFPELDRSRKSGENIIACVERFLHDANIDDPTVAVMMVVGYANHCQEKITEQAISDVLQSSPLFSLQRPTVQKKINDLITHKKIKINPDNTLQCT